VRPVERRKERSSVHDGNGRLRVDSSSSNVERKLSDGDTKSSDSEICGRGDIGGRSAKGKDASRS